MPQSTNLNKSPYFDDFSEDKNYYKVLFKPGTTVQSRELTTLQSILQNQIEKFGTAFYTNGGVVIPGASNYDGNFTCVEVESTYKGINIEAYYENLVGKTIKGKLTGISAKVLKVLSKEDSERANTTLYVKYISSSDSFDDQSFTKEVFDDGEELITLSDIPVGDSYIFTNSEFARVISLTNRKATSVGSAANLTEGVYFVRGYFIGVETSTIILDQYTNTPSYRVGLEIVEDIIDSDEDPSLNDNAQGFSNYAAPGADRLKITLNLSKKSIDNFNDDNFIELFRVTNGIVTSIKKDDKYSFINDILARRTYDESGNYYVNAFNIQALESLNDNLGNGGLYTKTQKTPDGSSPSIDLGLLKVSPGKAYVKGYEIPTSNVLIDYPKPRTTKSVESSSTSFYGGDLIRINNVKGSPTLGLTTTFSVSLLDQRLTNQVATGTTVGFARVYDFESHNTSFENPSSQANLYLFDIQTYTNLTLSGAISSLNVGSYVKGKNSGAFGYAKEVSGASVKLYQVSGKFSIGETLIVNGIEFLQTLTAVRDYSIDDVKSIYNQSVSFVGDTLLSKQSNITGQFTAQIDSGIGTITSNNGSSFASSLKVNDVLSFTRAGLSSSVYVKITSIAASKNQIAVTGESTVQNVCTGNIGSGTTFYQISDLKVIKPQVVVNSESSSLYTELNHSNISNVSTLNSNVYIKKQYTGVSKSSTTLTLPTLVGDYTYASFDEERYVVVNADGTLENLSNATFTRSNGNKNAEFTNLSSTAGPCSVITTQIKSNVTNKFKKLNRCSFIDITKTKYSTPPNAGLTSTSVYGVRVEDNEISLNYPDIFEVQGIFESTGTGTATPSWISLTGITGPNGNTLDLIVGEILIGQDSGAVAVYAENKTTSQIYIIYKNQKVFSASEIVSFEESGYTATVSTVNVGSTNITNDFYLDNGQRKQFYDFGRIVRKNSSKEPSHRIRIYFDRFSFESTDNGDVITVNSYPSTINKNKIPVYNQIRNLDTIDVRPRVSNYNTLSTISPFDFGSRDFSGSGSNATQILSSNEDFIFDYSFYLPRYDKLTLSSTGEFELVLGFPAEDPKLPTIFKEVLDVATILSVPYVYDLNTDIVILLTDNRRYTMSDLRDIENRVESLEYYTSLSLLESTTKNLLIEDENGFNRFKSGFFVDNFSSSDFSNTTSPIYRSKIENNTISSPTIKNLINLSLYSNDSQNTISEINLSDTNSSNLKLTGNTLTLSYTETDHVKQPFASRIVNINPYQVVTWSGLLNLNPNSDTWTVEISESRRVANVSRVGSSDASVTTASIPYIRSRNIEFVATRLKPNTKFKLLFDSKELSSNVDGFTYVFPKLLQITDVTGSFQIGETVTAYTNTISADSQKICTFRLCTPNHKFGKYNSPESTYTANPYSTSSGIATVYGPQSTLLNIDTSSLEIANISKFYGNLIKGCKLYGETSKAIATVSENQLITDNNGTLIGSIFIPDPNNSSQKYNTGRTPVRVTQSTSLGVPGEFVSSAESVFTSSGTEVKTTTINYYDPLAQSFIVEDQNGIVPSSVDVFFASKDSNIPVSLQIREVINGTPGGPDKIVGNLEKVLNPSQIITSSDASKATTFTFDNLTRLEGGREYAVVLLSDSFDYNVWVSRVGEVEISTASLPEVQKVIINSQPSLGSLFISQNGTTWTAVQTDDLKFTLKKCKFSTAGGTARFYNSKVEVEDIENRLPTNPIVVGVGSDAPNNGYFMQIIHPNHGMNSASNIVKIEGVSTDVSPTTLTAGYGITATGSILVTNNSNFTVFEGQTVSPANPGYVLIDEEIIKYENASVAGELSVITRGIQNSPIINHPVTSLVYKYEFNGVSLTGINTSHTISNSHPITIDSYYIGIAKSFTSSKFGGGNSVYATKNKLYNAVGISSEFVSVFNGSTCSASLRSISGQSVDGNESPFEDQGYSSLSISNTTTFNTIRLVASEENENQFLNATQFSGNKSLTLDLNLGTSDSNVSPIINVEKSFLTVNNNRITQPIVGIAYTTDNRVNSNVDDPHTFIHITNRVDLLQSANALKVLLDAYRPADCEIRVLYKLFRNDSPDEDQVWNLFPGYTNLDVNGNVKNEAYNNGLSDKLVASSLSNQYLEYEYTMNNLEDFTGFAIKIVCSSTNQAVTPIIQNLRVIALK